MGCSGRIFLLAVFSVGGGFELEELEEEEKVHRDASRNATRCDLVQDFNTSGLSEVNVNQRG